MRVQVAAAIGLIALGSAFMPGLSAQRAVPRNPARAPQAAAPRDSAVPFKVGETLTFDVAWSAYMVAGTAVTTVRERRQAPPNASAYYIVAEGRPLPLISRLYSLYYKMDTLLDAATLLPQQMTLYSEEGRRQRLGTTRFDRAARRAFFEISGGSDTFKSDINIPPQVQDGLSALYAVRASALGPNTKLTYPIIDDGSLYTVTMQTAGTERVRVPAGEMNTWKLGVSIVDEQGQSVGQNVGIWLTNDERKMPVKLQADLPVGSFTLALREATQGQ
jgi:hypothetical protein